MAEQGARLTTLGKLLSILLIAGLLGFGGWIVWRSNQSAQAAREEAQAQAALARQNEMAAKTAAQGAGNPSTGSQPATGANAESAQSEAPDTASVTTVKEYKYVPADRLPAVKGVSQYKWDANNKVLRFSYNVWSGWLPVIAANHGAKPNAESIFAKKYGFQVEMVLMDDPVAARDAFASGDVHTLWGTVDMMALFAGQLVRDSRTAPRIVQQIDWSDGGDGIVVRGKINSANELKGKTIALAQNSPSEYYLTSLLLAAGLKPADVNLKYTATAFEAAAAFVADKSINACVTWAPDIYNIADRVAGTKILSSTEEANKLIADVYAFRADFMRDHPEVVEGFVAGVFEGMELVKQSPEQACAWLADAFGMKPEDVQGMMGDAHATNFAENVQFFLNESNPANFERTWSNSSYVYRELGRIDAPVPFDNVVDFSVIKKLQQRGLFADQKDESVASFQPGRVFQGEDPKTVTQTIRINFYPNSANPYEQAHEATGAVIAGKLYDPNVDATLEAVGRLAGQFGRCVILIEGHTDASMKGRAPEKVVAELSLARAEAIKQALITKFKFDPDKFQVAGKGWSLPFDPTKPDNHALNRRVEISVYPPEQK